MGKTHIDGKKHKHSLKLNLKNFDFKRTKTFLKKYFEVRANFQVKKRSSNKRIFWHFRIMVITAGKLHSRVSELSFPVWLNPAYFLTMVSESPSNNPYVEKLICHKTLIRHSFLSFSLAWQIIVLWKSITTNAWKVSKYGPEKTPYLDTFHAVNLKWLIFHQPYLWIHRD